MMISSEMVMVMVTVKISPVNEGNLSQHLRDQLLLLLLGQIGLDRITIISNIPILTITIFTIITITILLPDINCIVATSLAATFPHHYNRKSDLRDCIR